jgi:hypothetical protein
MLSKVMQKDALFCFPQHDFVSGYMLQLLGASVIDTSIFSPPCYFYAQEMTKIQA